MSDTINLLDYGVLPTGFSRMRLPEIRQAIIDSLQNKTQLTFETRPDSITGQFIDVFAEREAAVWELAQAVYHAMYPISAFGVNLDHAVSFAGVTRLFAQQSLAWIMLYGVQDTIVASGAIVKSSTNSKDFILQSDVTIDAFNVGDITLMIDVVVTVGQTYSVTINKSGEPTITATYIAGTGDTNVYIAEQLYNQLLNVNYVVDLDANTIRIYRVDNISFKVVRVNVSIAKMGSIGVALSTDYGPNAIPINSITEIITTQDGWDAVDNVVPGQPGRNTETDDELRLRYTAGVYRLGAATVNSIKANLDQNIVGLINCAVYENVKDEIDADGRPPHCIEVVAYGGDPTSIAKEIFRTKPAGIDTFGSVTISVIDTSGYYHDIHFNRPAPVYVWVSVQINLYNEELFPATGDQAVANSVVTTGNNFGVGKDIIIQRFLGPIYSAVSGIGNITITTAVSTDPAIPPAPGDYIAGNRPIAVREISQFDLDRVTVVIVPLT